VSELAAGFASHDSPIEMTDLARTYGVLQTTLAEFVEGFIATTSHRDVNVPAAGDHLGDLERPSRSSDL
jgi:hypothetical protein